MPSVTVRVRVRAGSMKAVYHAGGAYGLGVAGWLPGNAAPRVRPASGVVRSAGSRVGGSANRLQGMACRRGGLDSLYGN